MPRIAVFGLGQFGTAIAEALTDKGVDVMAFDHNAERVEEIKDRVSVAVVLDSTDERALRAVGLDQVRVAIVTMGTSIEANILTSALLKQLGVPRVYARANTELQEQILRAIRVDKIINVEREMGEALAATLSVGEVHRFFNLATGHSLVEIDVPAHLIGKTIEQAQLRQRHSVNIVAIKKQIDAGAIGKPAVVRASRCASQPLGWQDWYRKREMSGGVCLDLIIHDFDFLRWCFGDVERVYAKGTTFTDIPVEYALVTPVSYTHLTLPTN